MDHNSIPPRPKKYVIRWERVIVVGLVFIIVIILIASGIKGCSPDGKDDPNQTSAQSGVTTNATVQTQAPNLTLKFPASAVKKGSLILVNSANECIVPDPNPMVSIFGNANDYYMTADNASSLHPEAIASLNRLTEAYAAANGNAKDFRVVEAFKPGNTDMASDYATGYGFRLGIRKDGGTYDTYKPEGRYAWFMENCHRYGFILRYPEEKKELTGNDGNLSRFRYVGLPHSVYMKENNLCLEEYVAYVKERFDFTKNHLPVTTEQGIYEVYYIRANPAEDVEITVNTTGGYSVSGNNSDGFIVAIGGPKTDNPEIPSTGAQTAPPNETLAPGETSAETGGIIQTTPFPTAAPTTAETPGSTESTYETANLDPLE
jgi:D-alanyl-D-alanine carboxypeptidase